MNLPGAKNKRGSVEKMLTKVGMHAIVRTVNLAGVNLWMRNCRLYKIDDDVDCYFARHYHGYLAALVCRFFSRKRGEKTARNPKTK